jgi:hypothetical protein
MKTRGSSKKRTSEAPEEPLSVWLKAQALADMLGFPVKVLENWRIAGVGPPYIKLSLSRKGRVRYRRDMVLEWQKSCLRIVPEGWQPIRTFPGESMPSAAGKIEWMRPKQAAIATGIAVPTLTAWRKRAIGLPFIWIGGGLLKVVYDRHDVEVFISRRQTDPSVVPVIPRKVYPKASWTKEERARMNAEIWKGMGHSDEEIRCRLGPRFADLIWPK